MENIEKQHKEDVIDVDLIEDISDEKMYKLVQEGRTELLLKKAEEKESPPPRRPMPKWIFWVISIAMMFNVVALLPQTFSIPAIDFLITSAKLSTKEHIKEYKEAVVVIETEDGKGTGFSINEQGTIITNYHVIEGEDFVTVAFPNNGLFHGEVVETYPEVDLAVLQIDGDLTDMPYLTIADETQFYQGESIYFIGNPLQFQGIANEGEVLDYIQLESKELPMLMLDAPVYRGNSGSPVINKSGEVIGIIFATLQHEIEGRVGLFIPIDYFHALYKE